MRRAYVEVQTPPPDAFSLAVAWAGDAPACVIGPSSRDIEDAPWLEQSSLPIGTSGRRHSRFTARPHGVVIAWFLSLEELLNVEAHAAVDGVVAVGVHAGQAAWTTAHEVEPLGVGSVSDVPEASSPIKAAIKGMSLSPVLNQGLVDSRERSMAIQALTYLRDRGHHLNPEQLTVEAIRNEWPGTSPIELAAIAGQLNDGKRLRFKTRLNAQILEEWSNA